MLLDRGLSVHNPLALPLRDLRQAFSGGHQIPDRGGDLALDRAATPETTRSAHSPDASTGDLLDEAGRSHRPRDRVPALRDVSPTAPTTLTANGSTRFPATPVLMRTPTTLSTHASASSPTPTRQVPGWLAHREHRREVSRGLHGRRRRLLARGSVLRSTPAVRHSRGHLLVGHGVPSHHRLRPRQWPSLPLLQHNGQARHERGRDDRHLLWPKAPGPGKNWIVTIPNQGWFTLLRLYGPKKAFFDQTWKPDDIKKSSWLGLR